MEEQTLKRQLRAYLENKLQLEEYDIFFDDLAQLDSDILQQWIAEHLASNIGVYSEERITALVKFDDLQEKINNQILADYAANRTKNLKTNIFRWLGYAAAVMCVVGFVTYLFNQYKDDSHIKYFENNYAYNISAVLPDSSVVILFPNTKISYALNNNSDSREIVHLKGKALYKVKRSKHPFKVNYSNYTTTALGTKFIVDAFVHQYPQIKLLEGKISISHNESANNKKVILENQGKVIIDVFKNTINPHVLANNSARNQEREIDKKLHLSAELQGKVQWSSNLLEVNQIKSQEIFKLLEQIYDVTILSENNDLLNYKFSGSINRDERIEDFLTNYCELNGCTFTNNDQIIVINTNQRKEVIR